jgi:hypothetical protein
MKRHFSLMSFKLIILISLFTCKINAQCTWKPHLSDGFEYQTACPDVLPGTVYTSIPQSYAVHTGSTALYLNFVNCGGGSGTCAGDTVYIREMAVCPNFEHRISAYYTTTFSGAQCDMMLVITDANLNVLTTTSSLLAPYSPTWINYQSAAFTPPTPTIKFIMITNIDGQNGNDLSMDDFLLEDCLYYNIGADTTLCINQTFNVNAGGGYASYLWNTGSTNQSITVATLNGGLNAANYIVQVTDSNGCMFSDTIKVTFDPCAAINEINPVESFHVYYDQVLDHLTIDQTGSVQSSTFILSDAAGKTVKRISFSNKKFDLSLAGIQTGIYFYRVEQNNKIVNRGKLFKTSGNN